MTTTDFISCMERDISAQTADIIAAKPEGQKFLTQADMKTLSSCIGNSCQAEFGAVPQQILVACKLAEAVVAPPHEKAELLREVLSMSRGLRGISAIIAAIGAALGWSGSAITVLVAVMTGANLVGLISVAAVISYFLILASPAKLSEKALAVLHQGVKAALAEHYRTSSPSPQSGAPQ